MRNTRKIFVALLVVLTLLMSMAVVASAAKTTGDTVIYLTPNENWKVDNARFAVYTWDGGDKWFDMTDSDGDGVYECTIPAGIENIIFCRMSPSATANNWTNKWNQTEDLKYDGTNNHYTVKEGTWDKGGGSWSLLETGDCIHSPSGEGSVVTSATCTENGEISHTCAKCGETYTAAILAAGHAYGADGKCENCAAEVVYIIAGDVLKIDSVYQSGDNSTLFGTSWDVTNEANKLEYDADLGCFVKVYENVAAGEYSFKVAVDKSWNVSYGADGGSDDCYVKVAEDGMTVTVTFKNNVPSATADHLMTPDTDPTPDTEKVYIIAGDVMRDENNEYVEGINFLGSVWDVTDENNMLVYDEALGCYVKVYENVFIGEYHFKVAVDKSWDVSYGTDGGSDNCYFKVEADGSIVTITLKDGVPSVVVEAPATPDDGGETPDDGGETPDDGGETPDDGGETPDDTTNGDTTPDDTTNGDTTPDDTTNGDTTPDDTTTGDTTPDDGGEEPEAELNFFQKIIKAITDFFANIGDWFKNLFAKE